MSGENTLRCSGYDHIRLKRDQFGRERPQARWLSIGMAKLQPDVAAFDVTKFAQCRRSTSMLRATAVAGAGVRKPTSGRPRAGCAGPVSGHATAAAPNPAMNSRRLIVVSETKTGHRIVADEHTERGQPGELPTSVSVLGQKRTCAVHKPMSALCQ
jgi:hypothetical protein